MSPVQVTKPRVAAKPWGREIIYAESDRFAGKILEVKKGQRLSLQYHKQKHETMYVQRGALRLTVGTSSEALEELELRPGDVIDLPPGTIHRLEALEDSEILEASSPELDDVVRLEDDYHREDSASDDTSA